MEWNNELALQLLDEYEKQPILWDAKHKYHFSRTKKVDAWDSIGHALQVEVYEVKQKICSLLGSFRREKAKGKKSVGTGKGRREIYISKWFAFERMNFLLDKDEPRSTIHTDDNPNVEEETGHVATVDNDSEMTQEGEILSVNIEPETPPPGPITSSTPSKTKQRKRKIDDPRLEEAYHIMKESVKAQQPTDYFSVYGQHIANKLRSYSKNTVAEVEHAFNNILYNADRGMYDRPAPTPHIQFFDSAPMHYSVANFPVTVNCARSPSDSNTSTSFSNSTCAPENPAVDFNLDMPDIDYTTL